MIAFNDILSKKTSISVIGLGYVGLPIAVAFAKKISVIGFDVNSAKIETYKNGIDPTGEVGDDLLKKSSVFFTNDPFCLKKALFHIVAVPTPVREDNTPYLGHLESASALLGKNLVPGSVVVFESTVYPGVTEDVCVPILEKESGLVCGRDFKVGYSPERISPGDIKYKLETIIKVVAGMDDSTTELLAQVYELVVDAGVYRAPSIKVAEAAKVIENSQRDLNIAFMNELSLIFKRLNIDTLEVLETAKTKWNFLNFRPGLVGGHCIGVDPYYLTYCAQKTGYHPQIILAGRRLNDYMPQHVVQEVIKLLSKNGTDVCRSKIAILGITFKENCPDTRNSRVIDIIEELKEYGIKPQICDPVADKEEAMEHYGLNLEEVDTVKGADCLIVAVCHNAFLDLDFNKLLVFGGLIVDVKGMFDPASLKSSGYRYWRL